MLGFRVASILLSTLAFGLAATAVSAKRSPDPAGFTLRCTKRGAQYALVHNVGAQAMPAAANIEVKTSGPSPVDSGTGGGQLATPFAPQATWTAPTKFSPGFTSCEARVKGFGSP